MKYFKNKKGTTFVELLIYVGVFLVITPVLINLSIDSARQQKLHNVEKQVNSDSQFVNQRINNLIASAKRIDVANSDFDSADGKLTLIMQDDSLVTIERNPLDQKIEITEGGVTNRLSADDNAVTSLYFERITDSLNDPEIVLGVTARLNIEGISQAEVPQNYVSSVNLDRGDFDGDGCPDFKDKFPRHADCCGDSDDDGICNEKDNCILKYNPFQEDFDNDGIGDECDDNVFLGDGGSGGAGGGLGAFNCSPDTQLLALIDQEPPLSSSQLKQILMSASPLPPTVLNKLIDIHPRLSNGHFRQVFVANVRLPDDVYDNLSSNSEVASFDKVVIQIAHFLEQYVPWIGGNDNTSDYDVDYEAIQCGESNEDAKIKFYNSNNELPASSGSQEADLFIINVLGGTEQVNVTTTSSSGIVTSTLNGGGSSLIDSSGFAITLESITGNNYAFTVTNSANDSSLQSIELDFGCGAIINSPSEQSNYEVSRYISYCEGGCADDCGDTGTGILTSNVYTDRCYQWNSFYPDWCSRWYTFGNNDSVNPAFMGGTEPGEGNVYWEKTFKTVLTQLQLAELKSITIGGEIAYQRTAQFFCDTLASLCKMDASLIGSQNVELYNWDSDEWEVIGELGLDGQSSDQQVFEVKYADPDIQKFVGGKDNALIKARMQFHWNGILAEGELSAPAFMLIDYFTAHLKW